MIRVDKINYRKILRTVVIELQMHDSVSAVQFANSLYSFAAMQESIYPFLMDMILFHDITVEQVAKPLPHGMSYFIALKAHCTNEIVQRHFRKDVNTWQQQLLSAINDMLQEVDYMKEYNHKNPFSSPLPPIATVYSQQANTFNLL